MSVLKQLYNIGIKGNKRFINSFLSEIYQSQSSKYSTLPFSQEEEFQREAVFLLLSVALWKLYPFQFKTPYLSLILHCNALDTMLYHCASICKNPSVLLVNGQMNMGL